ncbi:hypothetical protein KCP69_19580 [Salmonella enterica subsp. enterica]|nr:hypothetical protein KCP69_19580 [Salmonella enterica subsp. enterica]
MSFLNALPAALHRAGGFGMRPRRDITDLRQQGISSAFAASSSSPSLFTSGRKGSIYLPRAGFPLADGFRSRNCSACRFSVLTCKALLRRSSRRAAYLHPSKAPARYPVFQRLRRARLITQQIGIRHAYPVLIQIIKKARSVIDRL